MSPDPQHPQTDVVASVVSDAEGRLLLCRRPSHKRHGGLWEFPGGKVRDGEDWAAAVVRELHEELGVRVAGVDGCLFSHPDEGAPFVIHFVETRIRGVPQACEHSAIKWVPVADLASYPLAPADARFASFLAAKDVSDEPAG